VEPDAVDILMNVLKTVNDSKPNNDLRSYMENINFGKLTGIGVGPGDPELMTLKAINVIKNSDIIAFPGKSKDESMAFGIAEKAVPEIIEKELLAIDLPMTKDTKRLRKNHENAALTIEKHLKAGENIAFLTLGDPAFYSTFSYIKDIVKRDGFDTEIIAGVTSFNAVAAKLNIPISLGNESVLILPGLDEEDAIFSQSHNLPDNIIILKAGKNAGKIREVLKSAGYSAAMISNCGLENEEIFNNIDAIPDNASYFSLIIAKKNYMGYNSPSALH